jgi:hypothetical protein
MGKSLIEHISKADLLGEQTPFRVIVNGLVKKVVSKGKWFGFCTRVDDSQVNIFDLEGDKEKLGHMLYEEVCCDDGYRTSLYRYLLQDYLCYYEAPTVIKQKNYSGFKDSYNKYLITSNIYVVAEWMGISLKDAIQKYGSRLENSYSDDNLCPYVKLTVAKDGTKKVVKPRSDLDLSIMGTRIVPLFAIKTGIDVLYDICSKDFYNVTFVKDSGQKRTICVCFDYDKLLTVYKNVGLLSSAYEEQFKGDILNAKTLSRGYVRVIEVGTNIRNEALRSINLARILSIEKTEPDLTFINVNLDTVKNTFLSKLSSKKVNYPELIDMLNLFAVGTTRMHNGKVISSYSELESWVDAQEILLSTPFIKQLALFMMGNPQWFDGYTGEESEVVTPVEDYTTDTSDDDLEFDLDFD